MSYIEAKEDGISMKRTFTGSTAYFPPCSYCKEPVYSWSYRRGIRYTCKACRLQGKTKKASLKSESVHMSSHKFTCVHEKSMVV